MLCEAEDHIRKEEHVPLRHQGRLQIHFEFNYKWVRVTCKNIIKRALLVSAYQLAAAARLEKMRGRRSLLVVRYYRTQLSYYRNRAGLPFSASQSGRLPNGRKTKPVPHRPASTYQRGDCSHVVVVCSVVEHFPYRWNGPKFLQLGVLNLPNLAHHHVARVLHFLQQLCSLSSRSSSTDRVHLSWGVK